MMYKIKPKILKQSKEILDKLISPKILCRLIHHQSLKLMNILF